MMTGLTVIIAIKDSEIDLIFINPYLDLPILESEPEVNENELKLELFLNELRDNEFETMTFEMLQKLERNFEAYALQQGLTGEIEIMVAHPNFENVVKNYFEASMGQMAQRILIELDSFSNYIQTAVPIGVEYDIFEGIVDSYQAIHSEAFIKKFVRRVARRIKGFAKRGIRIIRKVASGIDKDVKMIISGSLNIFSDLSHGFATVLENS